MSGLDVVGSSNVPANDTLSVVPCLRLACIGLELPLHAAKRVVRASSHSQRGVSRARDKGQSLVTSFCPS